MINTLYACTQNAQKKISVDGTSDLSERKFKFFGGEKSHKNPKQKKMMQKSQPTKEKEEERERHKPHSRAILITTRTRLELYIYI
jgi:hypothetical protein